MDEALDLSLLNWTLTGWRPDGWRLGEGVVSGGFIRPEIGPIPAQFPGSVHAALRRAGLVPDWNEGLNARAVEWVEHRDWMFTAELDGVVQSSGPLVLHAETLDFSGFVLIDGAVVGEFGSPHRPWRSEITRWLTVPGTHQLAGQAAPP